MVRLGGVTKDLGFGSVEDMVKKIADMKLCKLVGIGLESGSEEIRRKVLQKSFTNDQVYNSR